MKELTIETLKEFVLDDEQPFYSLEDLNRDVNHVFIDGQLNLAALAKCINDFFKDGQ